MASSNTLLVSEATDKFQHRNCSPLNVQYSVRDKLPSSYWQCWGKVQHASGFLWSNLSCTSGPRGLTGSGLTTSWPLSIHQTPEGLTQISPDTEKYVCQVNCLLTLCFFFSQKRENLCCFHYKPKGHWVHKSTAYFK